MHLAGSPIKGQQEQGPVGVLARLAHFITILLLVLLLLCLTGWSVLAIYYGDSHTGNLQRILAGLVACMGGATIVSLFSGRWRKRALTAFTLLFVVVTVWWYTIEPKNNRNWQTDVAELPYARIDGDLVTVHNIRNFSYRTETEFTPAYYTKTYDLAKLESIDLFVVYWMGPAIAHTIVSFGFGKDGYLAVSIEARKEQHEGYSAIKGFLRQYELIYVVADERDVIRLRTNYRHEPPEDVYIFRLQGSVKMGRDFFLEYIKSINGLVVHPRFYNTLMTNCTNAIWMNAHINPDRVPVSWKLLASGYVPEYLYDMDRLDTSVPFEELKKGGYVNPLAQNTDTLSDFSRRIRTGIKK